MTAGNGGGAYVFHCVQTLKEECAVKVKWQCAVIIEWQLHEAGNSQDSKINRFPGEVTILGRVSAAITFFTPAEVGPFWKR